MQAVAIEVRKRRREIAIASAVKTGTHHGLRQPGVAKSSVDTRNEPGSYSVSKHRDYNEVYRLSSVAPARARQTLSLNMLQTNKGQFWSNYRSGRLPCNHILVTLLPSLICPFGQHALNS